jgi:DNA-directed RNA polymerase-3 subunit RPC5
MSIRIKSENTAVDVDDDEDLMETVADDAPISMDDAPISMDLEDDEEEEDEEEEDEVVREFDVFLSPELSKDLYMMQFPLQHESMLAPTAARIRPRHLQVELDYQTPDDIQVFGQFSMANRTYASSTIPISTHLTLGKMVTKDGVNGLHLVPLSKILQMRPSFHHVDEAAMYAMATTPEEARQLEKAALAANGERQALGLQKKESERAAMQRKSSYAYKKASEESEPWQDLEVSGPGGPMAAKAFEKVICPNPDDRLLVPPKDDEANNNNNNSMNAKYMQSLNYLPLSQKSKALLEEGPTDELSKVGVQLVQMMGQGWPMPYSIVRAGFPASISDETIFQALNTCALLVRGNFILHSKYLPLIPKVAEARTFILFILQTLEICYRARLELVFGDDDDVPSEALKMLLDQVAQKTNVGWKLKIEEDETFAERYPDAVQVHLSFWVNQIRRFGPFLEKYRQTPSIN